MADAPLSAQYEQSPSALGSTDTDIERTFFDLAIRFIGDKFPELSRHMLGFQAIDRDDGGDNLIGIFHFRWHGHDILVPIFFFHGELKGYDAMYVRDMDLLVPLDKAWLDHLKGRGSSDPIGRPMDRNRGPWRSQGPNVRNLFDDPFNRKYSSLALRVPEAPDLDLRTVCRKLGPDYFKHACAWLRSNEKFAERFFCHYPMDELVKLAEEMGESRKTSYRPHVHHPSARITIIDDPNSLTSALLTDEQKSALLLGEIVVEDARVDHEKSALLEMGTDRLFNPTRTGLYLVMTDKGLSQMLIFSNPVPAGRGVSRSLLLVDPDTRSWCMARCQAVYAASQESDHDMKRALEKLESDQSSAVAGSLGVFIAPDATVSIPLYIDERLEGSDRTTLRTTPQPRVIGSSDIRFSSRQRDHSTYVETPTDPWGNSTWYMTKEPRDDQSHQDDDRVKLTTDSDTPAPCCSSPEWSGREVVLTRRSGTRLRQLGSLLCVPSDAKWIRLGKFEQHMLRGSGAYADLSLKLAGLGAVRIKLASLGNELILTTPLGSGQPRTSTDTLRTLMYVHGLDEPTSRELIKLAQSKGRAVTWIKYAQGYPFLSGNTWMSPGVTDGGYGSDPQLGVSLNHPFTDVRQLQIAGSEGRYPPYPFGSETPPYPSDPMVGPAAGTDNKEFMDAAMLGSLLKSINSPDMIESALPDLMRALHRLGSTLLLFYRKHDEFEERYGSDDLPELERGLRSTFTSLGKLVLYLRQRSIHGEEPDLGVNLETVQ